MSPVGMVRTFFVCGFLLGTCVGQNASPVASNNNNDVRPAIFLRGALTLQVSASSKVAQAQLSTSSFHIASDEEVGGMEKTLEQYVAAFESLSLPQVKQIWPELDVKHSKAFKEIFSAFKGTNAAPRLGLQCAVPRVIDGTANVECRETVTYHIGKGKTKEAGPARVDIQLKEQESRWVVQDMRGAG